MEEFELKVAHALVRVCLPTSGIPIFESKNVNFYDDLIDVASVLHSSHVKPLNSSKWASTSKAVSRYANKTSSEMLQVP